MKLDFNITEDFKPQETTMFNKHPYDLTHATQLLA